MAWRGGEVSRIAAPHRMHGVGGADQRRQRHVGGMGIADRVVLDRTQAEALRRVIGRLLEAAVVETEPLGLAIFKK